MNLLFLSTAPSDYMTPWWPLWSVWLISVPVLFFVGRPTQARRTLGIAWLGLGFFLYSWALFACNGCIEGYADWTSCDVAGQLMTIGVLLLAGSAVVALSNLNRR